MYWVSYDITSTKKRNQMVRLCEDFGLRRVQKSCFVGDILDKRVELFYEKIQGIIIKEDSVIIIPLSGNALEKIVTFGNEVVPLHSEIERILFV